MKMTKRHKALVAVFLVGVAGMVVDRTLLRPQGGPGAASGESSRFTAGPAQGGSSVLAPQDAAPKPKLAERLNSLSSHDSPDFSQMRNAFALPPSWFDDRPADAKATVVGPAAQFVRDHRLEAVAEDGEDSYILIDDRFLTLGKQIDGFTLVAISDGAAVFERDGEQVRLELMNK